MKCPLCNTQGYITGKKNVFKKEEGKLYSRMTFECRNKKCANHGKVIGEKETELPFYEE